jgi:uncharacterized membrane protein (UPF0127 family)
MRGLLGRKRLALGEGILLQPAASIHTAFMLFSIDAVFLNGDLEVVDVRPNLKPWRTASCRGAKAVLELAAGEAERRGMEVGDRLLILDSPPATEMDLAGLFERVGVMLGEEIVRGQYGWHEIEYLLTEGYAQALALESERLWIERRLEEWTASRKWIKRVQARSLALRHDALDRDIRCLRALLAELYDHGRVVRNSAEPRTGAKRASRAA